MAPVAASAGAIFAATASLQLLQQLQYGERSSSGSVVRGCPAPQQAASGLVALEGLGVSLQAGHERRDALLRRQQALVSLVTLYCTSAV
jgi:hypothetical protein